MATSSHRQTAKTLKRVVVKIGSALLTNDGKGLDKKAIAGWVSQLCVIAEQGVELVLVSSGAVAQGMADLGWQSRPDSLPQLQAAAAVGQVSLLQYYQQQFSQRQQKCAQVLLVHDDLSHRRRYLNARNTLMTLLDLSVIAIVNENDTVATEEIRFGDNDTLAAMVANIVDADLLVILTDQEAMFTDDPRHNPNAQKIEQMAAGSPELYAMAGDGGALGRGGMTTKVRAAELAARSGTDTIIVGGRIENVLQRLFNDESLGTYLYAANKPLEARKLWLASLKPQGQLQLDQGATKVLSQGGASLLAVGVTGVTGHFAKGDAVLCVGADGRAIAKGLVDFSSEDCKKVLGVKSEAMAEYLGYQGAGALIHRDNLLLL